MSSQPNLPGSAAAGRDHTPSSRRSKVTTACLPCRKRKVKCDGQWPTCSRCAAASVKGISTSCSWDDHVDGRRADAPTASAAAGTKRRHTDFIGTFQGQDNSHSGPSPSSLWRNAHQCPSLPSTTDKSHPGTHHHDSFGHLGRIIQRSLTNQRGRRFLLGSASVAPLTTSIAGQQSSDDLFQTQHRHSTLLLVNPPQRLGEESYELPRRSKADHLMAIYWDRVYPIFPLLDLDETTQAYSRLWNEPSQDATPPIFLCIANLLFATASRLDAVTQPESRDEASARYCRRALDLFNHSRGYAVSFASVQAALLIAEYLHSLHPEQCWVYTGIAIRMAQSLGLDRPRLTSNIQNPHALGLCQRVWKICIIWDRILCMTYGRSLMVNQKEATAFLSSASSSGISFSPQDIVEKEVMISLFLDKSLQLYCIMGHILEDFSAWDLNQHDLEPIVIPSPDNKGCAAIDRVLIHERSLQDFKLSLPPCLLVPKVFDITNNVLQQRQAVILYQRILQCRIVLLRPLLSYLVKQENQKRKEPTPAIGAQTLSHGLLVQSAIACVTSAMEAIDIIHTGSQPTSNPSSSPADHFTHPWWNNVLLTYNSAIVLIAARLCLDTIKDVPSDKLEQAWSHALDIFKLYEPHGVWVKQVSSTLCLLAGGTDFRSNEYLLAYCSGYGHGSSGKEISDAQQTLTQLGDVGLNTPDRESRETNRPSCTRPEQSSGDINFFPDALDIETILEFSNYSFIGPEYY